MEKRIKLTSSCRYCDILPKVTGAGDTQFEDGKKISWIDGFRALIVILKLKLFYQNSVSSVY